MRIPLGHRPVVFALPGSRDLAARTVAQLRWSQGLCSFKAPHQLAPRIPARQSFATAVDQFAPKWGDNIHMTRR